MQYIYDSRVNSSLNSLSVDKESYKYLFKVRRKNIGDDIYFRNLEDDNIYRYKVVSISKKDAILELQSSKELIIKPKKDIHIGWCVIDIKNIEKSLPSLNELGVSKISFIYCDYSQKNFKQNQERVDKILLTSNIQSGRSDKLQIEYIDSLEEFKSKYPDSYMFNFSKDKFISDYKDSINSIVIGCEGGFSKDEVSIYQDRVVGIDSPLILRSETAVITVASVLL
jgi:16S rRNA (uracil1498-N3)-methyltransferase